jgi:hypothetical protein
LGSCQDSVVSGFETIHEDARWRILLLLVIPAGNAGIQ